MVRHQRGSLSNLHLYPSLLQLPEDRPAQLQLSVGRSLTLGFGSRPARVGLDRQLWAVFILFIDHQRMFVVSLW